MFNIISPNSNYNFSGLRKFATIFSFVAIIGSFALLFTKGLNFGIDFTGGAELTVKLPETWDTEKLRQTLTDGGYGSAKILNIGEASEHEFLIRLQQEGDTPISAVVSGVQGLIGKQVEAGSYEIKSADIVGPAAGGLLRKNGFLALFYALVGILLYVAVRFDFRYAPGAVFALFHDTVLVLGIFVITQTVFDLTVLAAILALIGYSNNDTIIVFDRVRETRAMNPNLAIDVAVNQAINQTLGRTIMTSLTTVISVGALLFFGGPVLRPFAFALFVGIFIGTYSSVFVASSAVIWFTERSEKQKLSGKQKKRREVKLSPEAHVGL